MAVFAVCVVVLLAVVIRPAFGERDRSARESSGSLLVARALHTATRLPNGAILIVGGSHSGEALRQAELLDAGIVRPAAEAIEPRASHTATLLSDGRVLIAGGRNAAGDLDSTEIYDAASDSFAVGPRMNHARSGHTATTLASGALLVAGSGSAEIFDGESFRAVAPMNESRQDHSAVTLLDGRVLFVGGRDAEGHALKSAEIFDPSTETFFVVSAMSTPRIHATLRALPDGKVQVIGGDADATMEIFNPAGYFTAKAYVLKTGAGVSSVARSSSRFAVAGTHVTTGNAVLDNLADRSDFASASAGSHTLLVGGFNRTGLTSNSVSSLGTTGTWVTTDKSDYAPGETVTVTGGGFAPGETVSLLFERNPETSPSTTLTTVADAEGNIRSSDYVCLDTDAWVTFLLTATGQSSSSTAQTSFTDGANSLGSLSVGAQSPSPVTAGSSATYIVTVNRAPAGSGVSGNFTVSLGVTTALPSGVTAAFSADPGNAAGNSFTAPDQLTVVNANNTGTVRLTLATTTSTPGNLPAGVSFTVHGVNVAGASNTADGNGVLKVDNPCTAPSITAQPVSQTITFGANASFSTTATGTAPLTVQWQVSTNSGGSWSNLFGETNTSLTVTAPVVAQSGTQYRAVFTNGCGATKTSAVATLTVNKAPSTTTVSCPLSMTYTGSALEPCTASVTGAGGLSQTLTVSYANNTNAGTATASASYGGDANHDPSSDSETFTIDKGASTTVVTCPAGPFIFDGSPQTPCSASVTGSGGLNQSLTVSYTDNTNAGTASASASFAGDANHDGSSDSETFTIDKAASVTVVTCPTNVTYTGAALTPCGATVTGAGGLSESLTVSYSNNTDAGTAGASASFAGDANHDGSSDSETFTIDKAASTTVVSCPAGPFTFNGSPQTPCSASVTGAGGLNQPLAVSYTDNTNAGTATASASYAGDANHEGSSDSKDFTVDKAASTTVVTCPTNVTYTGAPLEPCSASVTGAGGLSETLTVSYSDNTDAGTATASASFAGDANHETSSDSESFTIDKAASVTVVTCPTNVTYTGAPLEPCSASVTGAGGLSESLTVSYSDNTDAGTATASASFAGDANHDGSNDSKTFTIDKATSTTAVTCPTNVTYTGDPLEPCSANVTGSGALNQSLTVNYSNNTNAGSATASASYAGDTNHTASSDSKTFTIDKASSQTVVACPASVTYIGSAQTPCTANVTGAGGLNSSVSIAYSNNVNAGIASATAAYAGDTNHTGSSDSKTFAIDKANPILTWANPAAINCGTALSPAQLNATANVPGSFAYAPPAGTVLSTGVGQVLNVAFTPGDSGNYNNAFASVVIDVTNANPNSVTIAGPTAPVASGTTISATATFADAGDGSAHTAIWSWDDGSAPQPVTIPAGIGTVTTTHKYVAAGVYTVQVVVTDTCGLSSQTASFQYVVVYDASGGFVTGGGWINSPAGAYPANAALSGKATFGFVSKYQKGATIPTGETEFQFQVAGFNFKSAVYEWLVVSGSKAQYKGSGTVNGGGSYGFLLTATDGGSNGLDKFRIKIWDKGSGGVVYDNAIGSPDDIDIANPQVLGGGSIVIHK